MPLTNSLYDMNSTLRIRVTLALILIFTFFTRPQRNRYLFTSTRDAF